MCPSVPTCWLALNQDNVSECADVSVRGLLLYSQLHYKNPTKCVGLALLKINLFSPWYKSKTVELALNNNHSLTYSLNFIPCISVYIALLGTVCFTEWRLGVEYWSGIWSEILELEWVSEWLITNNRPLVHIILIPNQPVSGLSR